MLETWVYALGSVLVISLASFAGAITLIINRKRLSGLLVLLVGFSVGALFGDAFIHLIPEAMEELDSTVTVSAFLILGVLIFFILEKFVRWRHCHVPTSEDHPHPVATMNIVGDGVHNLIDGMVIAGSYMVSPALGLATTVAVLLHEIPQEMGDFGVLLHAGVKRRNALLLNFLSALTAVAGAVLVLVLGARIDGLSLALLPIAAGGFIYIAGTDLIPELHREVDPRRSLMQFLAILMGVAVMVALTLLE